MRAKVQERRKPKLAEFSFLMPEFKKLARDNLRDNIPKDLPFDYLPDQYEKIYKAITKEEELTSNHFVSVPHDHKVHLSDKTNYMGDEEIRVIEPAIVNGYDGFSGVHDNLVWNPVTGLIVYTLHNKVIIE
jgi:hypothetical protein